jgi:TolB-like protein/class 3 adenylate cyclase/Tfp pilus assembly protein PilF
MPLAREQRKLAAILFADAVGSSRLMGRDESGTVTRLLEHLNLRLAPAVARRGGRVIRLKGDGGLVEVASAVDALAAAIDFQQGMVEANRDQPDDKAIEFRIGLHLGDVIVEGDDIYGDDVNVAARLEAEAPPGGIVVSRAVRDAVQGRLKVNLHALGELALKNINRPIRAFRVEWQGADWHTVAVSMAPSNAAAGRPSALADKPSIAVLAFRNMSGDAGREYLADGISEDIITTLSRIPNFVVMARSSSFSFRGRSVDVRQIGSELGVRYVVDGSVQQAAGKSLRISCVLIDAGSGRHLWAERYDGAMDELFELQDRITASIAATLYPKVMGTEIARAQTKPTASLSAYDLYLRGVAAYNVQRTESSLDQALALLHQAIAIDPQFSSAWAWIARVHWGRIQNGWGPFREVQALGQEAARRAVETGQDDPVALGLGGFGIAYLGGKTEDGVAHIERALALNPNFLLAWRFGGAAYSMLGDHGKAIQYFERAMRLSPLDNDAFQSYHGISLTCFFLGHYDQAVEWSERALRDKPRSVPALLVNVAALALRGHHADQLPDLVRQLLSIVPGVTIKSVRRSMSAYRAADRKLYEDALRTAGISEC